ncbi:MAG: hypothetical protein FJX64_04360 [Alphaproteobacteria bacterium]|nr:hypothetical protein [Alphaproteobacteria bacterium]
MFVVAGPLPMAQAAMVPTNQVLQAAEPVNPAATDRERLNGFLARDDVRRQMETLGVDPNDARMRVAAMPDSEVARLVGKLDQTPAGAGWFATLVWAVVVIAIVLLITDLLGVTDVYPLGN